MKYIKFILLVIAIIFCNNLKAQEKKEARGYLKLGSGYYLDLSSVFDELSPDELTGIFPEKVVGGSSIWIEGGYKLPNNLIISGNILYALFKYKYRDIIFQGHDFLLQTQNYAINLSYELNKKGRHKFTPGIGLLLNVLSLSRVSYNYAITPDNEIVMLNPTIIDDAMYELGINLNLDYHYQFKNNFFIGARINTVVLISIGLESMVFSPVLGVKF